MTENILFYKIRKKWRPWVVRELLIELLCTKFNLELVENKNKHERICCLRSENMLIIIRKNILDVLVKTELKQASKEYLDHLFYDVGMRKK